MKLKGILFLVLLSQAVFAQGKWDANWGFGKNAGIAFSDSGTQLFVPITNNFEAASSISDSAGNLLFYLAVVDGFYDPQQFLDKNNNMLINGNDIDVNTTCTNCCAIIPVPGSSDTYYAFYISGNYINTSCGHYWCLGLKYAIVQNQNDTIKVVAKNVPLIATGLEEKLSLVKHANGRDWWLLAHQIKGANSQPSTDLFYKSLITDTGVSGPFYQNIGTLHYTDRSCQGEMVFSHDGGYLSVALDNQNEIDLLKFDRCSGLLSTPVALSNIGIGYVYSSEFSPDNKNLYVTVSDEGRKSFLYKFELNNSFNKYNIWTDTSADFNIGQLEIGPDNKIYLTANDHFGYPYPPTLYTQYNTNLSVINEPNGQGTAVDFQPFSFPLGDSSRTYLGLPSFPNYNLGPIGVFKASAGKDTVLCINQVQGMHIGAPAEPNLIYQWEPNPSLVGDNAPQPIVHPTEDTYYILTITDTSATTTSCQVRMDTVFVDVEVCTGIERGQQSGSEVKVYPNPANEQLIIETATPGEFILYDLPGRVVWKVALTKGIVTLDISLLPEGLYIYRVNEGMGKVVVRH